VVDPSAWAKLSNIFSCFSSGIPIPVSFMVNRSFMVSSDSSRESTRTNTSPLCVNFRAFPVRFTMTCLSRPGSPTTLSGMPGGKNEINSNPFFWAFMAKVPDRSSIRNLKLKGMLSNSSLPASIFEKSRILLMMSSSELTSLLMVTTRFRWSSLSLTSSSKNSTIPIIPFIGVRIS